MEIQSIIKTKIKLQTENKSFLLIVFVVSFTFNVTILFSYAVIFLSSLFLVGNSI